MLEELDGHRISCSSPYWFAAIARDLATAAPEASLVPHPHDNVGIANVCMNMGVFLAWDIVRDGDQVRGERQGSGEAPGDFTRILLPERRWSAFGLIHQTQPSPEVQAALEVARELFGRR